MTFARVAATVYMPRNGRPATGNAKSIFAWPVTSVLNDEPRTSGPTLKCSVCTSPVIVRAVPADDAGECVDAKPRVRSAQRDVRNIHLQLVRVAADADRRVDLVDHVRHIHAGRPHGSVDVQRPVAEADFTDLDRQAVFRLVR